MTNQTRCHFSESLQHTELKTSIYQKKISQPVCPNCTTEIQQRTEKYSQWFFLLSKTGRIPEGWGKHGYQRCLEMQGWRGTGGGGRSSQRRRRGLCTRAFALFKKNKNKNLSAPFGVCLTEWTRRVSGFIWHGQILLGLCCLYAQYLQNGYSRAPRWRIVGQNQ